MRLLFGVAPPSVRAISSRDSDERRRHMGPTAREPASSLYFLRFARSLEIPLCFSSRDPARSPSAARVLPFARSRSLPHAATPSSSPCAPAPSLHPTRDDRDRIHRPFLPMTTTLSGSRSSSLVTVSLSDEHPPLRRRLLPSQ